MVDSVWINERLSEESLCLPKVMRHAINKKFVLIIDVSDSVAQSRHKDGDSCTAIAMRIRCAFD